MKLKVFKKPKHAYYVTSSNENMIYCQQSVISSHSWSAINTRTPTLSSTGFSETMNNLNLVFMAERFQLQEARRLVWQQHSMNLYTPECYQVSFKTWENLLKRHPNLEWSGQIYVILQGQIQIFWKEGRYFGHHGWPAKKILGFRWSEKVKITSETISFLAKYFF